MVLRLFECAIALAKHHNFARAAEAMGVSQPTLTRSIQLLEHEFSVKLFDRTSHGTEPTPFGEVLLARARRVSLDFAELKREIALLKGLSLGELTVGVGPIVAQTWLGDALGCLLAKGPKLRLRILDLDWWEFHRALHDRRIDLAVGEMQEASENPDISIEPLPRRQGAFYCRVDHPLLRLNEPKICDIGGYPLVGPKLPIRAASLLAEGKVMGKVAEDGKYFEPHIIYQNLDAVINVVRSSDAVGIATTAKLAPLVAAKTIAVIPFQAGWLYTNYAIMSLRERTLAPVAEAFCAEAREAERRYNETAKPYPAKV